MCINTHNIRTQEDLGSARLLLSGTARVFVQSGAIRQETKGPW